MYAKKLISAKITAFYGDINKEDCRSDAARFFNYNHTLNFEEIYAFMRSDCDDKNKNQMVIDFKLLGYEDYLRVYRKISPIFKHSEVLFKSIKVEQLNYDWLGDKQVFLKAFKTTPNKLKEHKTENVEKVLLLTAMLEFALGSIFYTISNLRTPPHLLKDLLCTKELEMCFGLEALTFLKLIIGTPKAINLRNIVWHGFPKPADIPTYYLTTLLLIIHSLGHILQAKDFNLIYRKQIEDFSTSLKTIYLTCNIPTNFAIDSHIYHATVTNNQLIPMEHIPYWQQVYFYLETAEYWRFVILILPQIELILRLLYAKFNDYDVSAKLDEYYITLDTIFEPTVPNTANQLNYFFNEACNISNGVLYFMYDTFLAPKGPRVRDKISHGEASMEAINNQKLCQTLLYLAFNLLTQNEQYYSFDKYESQFHVNSLAKISLNEANKTCNQFKQTFKLEFVERTDSTLDFIKDTVKIFQRPKKEPFYMQMITKIANLLNESCHNFEESIKLKQSLLVHHELHSKRRRTLENLINTLPKFCCFLDLALNCLSEIYLKLQASNQDFECENSVCLERFLKHTLRIAENVVKYSHKDSNEWIKITELSKTFDDFYKRLYLKFQQNNLS